MDEFAELENLVYALTLQDRKNKRKFWMRVGFDKLKNRPKFLVDYWRRRLQRKDPQDLVMYKTVLASYLSAVEKVKKSQEAMDAPDENAAQQRRRLLKKRYVATVPEMMQSAAQSAGKWIKGGLTTLPAEQVQARLDICKSCEFWDSAALKGTGRCTKCGCSTWAKIRLPHEQCPEQRWLAITE
jgi:hypothetical protein